MKKNKKRDQYTAFLEYALFIESVLFLAWIFCNTFLQ